MTRRHIGGWKCSSTILDFVMTYLRDMSLQSLLCSVSVYTFHCNPRLCITVHDEHFEMTISNILTILPKRAAFPKNNFDFDIMYILKNYYELRLTNDRPDLSSQRAPRIDRKATFRQQPSSRKWCLVTSPRVGSTPRHTDRQS
jgi:hypothetical protein